MGAIRLLDTPLDKSNFTLRYSINIDINPGNNSSVFALACGSNVDEMLVLEIYFFYNGKILIIENDGEEFITKEVGIWEKDIWYDVTITGDENEVRYYLNNELIHTGALAYNIDELRFAHDNLSGAAYIDDVSINHETLSVQDITLNPWTIYPNPASDVLNLEGLENVESYAIYDMTGRKLAQPNNSSKQIDVSHLNNGVYLLQINTDKGQVSKKFIKN